MSRWLALILAQAAVASPLFAQDTYGPADESDEEAEGEMPPSTSQPCETQEQEDGVILVCRELTDSERYMSPLPKPVESDRPMIPGLTDAPCWVQPRSGGGLCIRFGWAPEPAIMVDVTAFPEKLTEEEADHVHGVEGDEARERLALTGERVPIDLSED